MGKVNIKLKKNLKTACNVASSGSLKLLKKKSNEEYLPLKDNGIGILNKSLTLKKTVHKKEKLRRKHKKLLEKIVLTKKQQKEDRARKNRERNGGIVGDLKPLKDALPSLDELIKMSKVKDNLRIGITESNTTKNFTQQKVSAKQRLKLKKDRFIQKVSAYEALLKDPDFRKNPREAIKCHIAQKYTLNNELLL